MWADESSGRVFPNPVALNAKEFLFEVHSGRTGFSARGEFAVATATKWIDRNNETMCDSPVALNSKSAFLESIQEGWFSFPAKEEFAIMTSTQ